MYASKRAIIVLLGIALVAVMLISVLRQPAANTAPAAPAADCIPNFVPYDIVYVRAPRFGDNTNSLWPDTVRPLVPDGGADLRLLHPNCSEELLFPISPTHQSLVDAPLGNGSVSDPNVSFDGQWVVFTYYHDQDDGNVQRCAGSGSGCLSRKGADIYRLNLGTRETVRLTHQEFTPNSGNGANFNCAIPFTNCPNVGVFNVGPAFVARSDPSRPAIAFTSSRNNFLPPQAFNSAERVLQLFIMDWDGKNAEQTGYLNNAQALHPFQLEDGRLMFTSWEMQGARDLRQFNLWFIGPDGVGWNSGSGFGENAVGHHFMTQMPDGDIVVVRYYNLNNNGFGDLVRYSLDPAGPDFRPITATSTYMPFERPGQVDLTDWGQTPYELGGDFPAPCLPGNNSYNDRNTNCAGGNGTRVGKVTQPSVAPGGDLLLVYSPGPANHNSLNTNTPYYDGGIYVMTSTVAALGSTTPARLQPILNSATYNEQWPRPVVAYAAVFSGTAQPVVWPERQNDGTVHPDLPANTPLALIGSSSLLWRDTNPRPGQYGGDPDPFNASHEALFAWLHQGADAGLYTNDDVYALRILALLPSTDRTYPNDGAGFYNIGSERVRILGEIPVRHEGITDTNGNVDTSFLARIPSDTPFTFQTLDRNGMVLNMAQTWHQMRPGEVRYDCGGCHAHAKDPLDIYTTVAGQPGFKPTDLALQTPLLRVTALNGNPATITSTATFTTVEYFRDIRPILSARCAGCHMNDTNDGKLNLHADAAPVTCGSTSWPGTYYRLVIDNYDGCPKFGLGTSAGSNSYFIGPQLTRYMRALQSRESLLMWKLTGARLDGRTNATRSGDIDFTADPTHTNLLTWDERLVFARWIDIGAPIERDSYWGWFEDDLRPTLWVAPTINQARGGPVASVVVGTYDLESGPAASHALTVTFNITIGAQPPGFNFASAANPTNGGVITVALPAAIDLAASHVVLTVKLRDNAGHVTTVVRAYSSVLALTEKIYLPIVDK